MNWRRTLLGLLGVGALVVGSTMAGSGPLSTLVRRGVDALGNDYLFLVAIAGVGALLAAAMVVSGRAGSLEQTTMPDPERPTPVPAVGDEFDDRVRGLRFKLPVVGRADREATRERLRSVAVDVTMRAAGCSRSEAERRVAEGTWTDDDDAAAFLSGDVRGGSGHLAPLLDGETRGQRRARRTVQEIVARTRTEGVAA